MKNLYKKLEYPIILNKIIFILKKKLLFFK